MGQVGLFLFFLFLALGQGFADLHGLAFEAVECLGELEVFVTAVLGQLAPGGVLFGFFFLSSSLRLLPSGR